jgi:hypothetical protein
MPIGIHSGPALPASRRRGRATSCALTRSELAVNIAFLTRDRSRVLPVLICGVLISAALAATPVAQSATPVAQSATSHRFTASYTGKGHGATKGTHASGSATMVGRGLLIGRGTLTGSGRGNFVGRTCVRFSGTALVRGRAGSIQLSARGARACASSTNPTNVSFSGRAHVSGGTGAFRGAQGTLAFHGTYGREPVR